LFPKALNNVGRSQ